MFFKKVLFALALLHGAAAERDTVTRSTDVRRSLAAETSGLSIDEFSKVFDDLIFDMAREPRERRKLQEELLQTVDGEVTRDQVVAALTSLTKEKDGQKAPFLNCTELFKYFDKNGDGVLSITELVALFKYAGFGISLSNQLATALLLWYDKKPKDGVLNMKEIIAACIGGKQVKLCIFEITQFQLTSFCLRRSPLRHLVWKSFQLPWCLRSRACKQSFIRFGPRT